MVSHSSVFHAIDETKVIPPCKELIQRLRSIAVAWAPSTSHASASASAAPVGAVAHSAIAELTEEDRYQVCKEEAEKHEQHQALMATGGAHSSMRGAAIYNPSQLGKQQRTTPSSPTSSRGNSPSSSPSADGGYKKARKDNICHDFLRGACTRGVNRRFLHERSTPDKKPSGRPSTPRYPNA
jgi:hypothetical protein